MHTTHDTHVLADSARFTLGHAATWETATRLSWASAGYTENYARFSYASSGIAHALVPSMTNITVSASAAATCIRIPAGPVCSGRAFGGERSEVAPFKSFRGTGPAPRFAMAETIPSNGWMGTAPVRSREQLRAEAREYLRAIEARCQAAFEEEMDRREAEEPPEPAPDWVLDAKEAYYE